MACIHRIQCVFGVDERGDTARLLRVGDNMQCKRGLAGRFRSENLHDTAARQPADAEGHVKRK